MTDARPGAEALRRAQLYVTLHSGVGGDIVFYRAECAGAESVLELGVGNARVLSQLQSPIRVGLDNNAAMLELAAAAGPAIELLLGDMTQPPQGRLFDRIIIPYNGLLCLSALDKRQCLSRARGLLSNSGRLVFDLYFSDELHADVSEPIAEPEVDEEDLLVQLEASTGRWNVFEQNFWWPSASRLEARYRFVPVDDAASEPEVSLSINHHYLLEHELSPLLRETGFANFSTQVFNQEHEQIGVIAW